MLRLIRLSLTHVSALANTQTTFNGLTGDVVFLANGDRSPLFEVYNVR